MTFIPYTECRWRLLFGHLFALDIQICGPNLILVRDGSFNVHLNNSLPDLTQIPGLKVNYVVGKRNLTEQSALSFAGISVPLCR